MNDTGTCLMTFITVFICIKMLYKDGFINITNSLMRKNIRMEAIYLKLNDGIRG